jgi:asparagine synthase (glutamine-hydrolysing)
MQMVSDVPIGAFLSGGIDSSTVVGLMAAHSDRPIRTYSIGFAGAAADQYYNELPYARRVAALFGTEHREILVRPDTAALLPRLLWHMDEPVSDSAFITTYLVSEFARRDVTVILSASAATSSSAATGATSATTTRPTSTACRPGCAAPPRPRDGACRATGMGRS